jgi:hypothetical protein
MQIPRIIQNNSPLNKARDLKITHLLYRYSVILIIQLVCIQESEALKPSIYSTKSSKSKIMCDNPVLYMKCLKLVKGRTSEESEYIQLRSLYQ